MFFNNSEENTMSNHNAVKRRTRDLTKAQFLKALEKNGMKIEPYSFFGYVNVGDGLSISRFNGGDRYRDQLSYLIIARRKHWERQGK